MTEIAFYQIDAFTDRAFTGNPAAVCPMPAFLSDRTMQAIAAENNLAETAFIVRRGAGNYDLRWFTPTVEIEICGHATLASAYVVFNHLEPDLSKVRFETRSGTMAVTREADGKLCLDFPNYKPAPFPCPEGLGAAMGAEPDTVLKSDEGDRDLLLVYGSAADIAALVPDQLALRAFAPYGFIATAPGDGDADFVSRCFFPNHGIPEDPVTGSAHCVSAPYWADRLGKTQFFARQVSLRGGDLWLEVGASRVKMAGFAVEVIRGSLHLPEKI
ncbi:PhzF family phenazine biosynthesis protein [Kordiimonas aestuarii]|uniref:PhzF family phenazine biosynthesis protein n=1 Tax=Kordiimonas aestuarii TaxID=1005925 RepID=UPI0021D365BF|nr:PhzF family phenazine biosynthesis protein [Kordiimonas aestuarii]